MFVSLLSKPVTLEVAMSFKFNLSSVIVKSVSLTDLIIAPSATAPNFSSTSAVVYTFNPFVTVILWSALFHATLVTTFEPSGFVTVLMFSIIVLICPIFSAIVISAVLLSNFMSLPVKPSTLLLNVVKSV